MNQPAGPGYPTSSMPAPPTSAPSETAVFPRVVLRGRGPVDVGLVVAAVWLVCSLAAGLWLMISSHSIASHDVKVPHLARTDHQAHVGDDHTGIFMGIQHSTADTADAIATLSRFDDASSRIERRESSRTNIGIGFVIISIGVVNMNLAIRRRSQGAQSSQL